MAIMNDDGMKISYDSTELINEMRSDLAEFGNIKFGAIFKTVYGVNVIYDYLFKEDISLNDLVEGEFLKMMTAKEILAYLIKQNEIF